MNNSVIIPIILAVEDALSEAVLREILRQSGRPYRIRSVIGRKGFGYLKARINAFNHAARTIPFIVMTDLDWMECPLELIDKWLPKPLHHHNLLLRIAVHEVEGWVMAHRNAFARFLGIPRELIPVDLDQIVEPKEFLIDLVRRSGRSSLRRDIIPPHGSTRKIGPDYNRTLIGFVKKEWRADAAQTYSDSLERIVRLVRDFDPLWEGEKPQMPPFVSEDLAVS